MIQGIGPSGIHEHGQVSLVPGYLVDTLDSRSAQHAMLTAQLILTRVPSSAARTVSRACSASGNGGWNAPSATSE